ncbi:MAG: carboxypeptidase regulatory-like domain-containing protein, partial [Acidobacteria bacterium]|nr:carboxypeptidase regulatory-like domain-containing protein [Acidobacteriota bacterium]
ILLPVQRRSGQGASPPNRRGFAWIPVFGMLIPKKWTPRSCHGRSPPLPEIVKCHRMNALRRAVHAGRRWPACQRNDTTSIDYIVDLHSSAGGTPAGRNGMRNSNRREERRTYNIHILMAAIAASLLLVPGLAGAQNAAISGVVSDTTGGVLPGVTVEARSPDMIEEVRTAITDGAGAYQVVALEPGTYSVTYSLPGFSTVVREGIELSLGFTANVDIQLAVGDIQETVTVSGASPVVDIQNVEQRQVMSREVIDSIPTGKSITGYGLLVPGMVGGESWGTPLSQDTGGCPSTAATMRTSSSRSTASTSATRSARAPTSRSSPTPTWRRWRSSTPGTPRRSRRAACASTWCRKRAATSSAGWRSRPSRGRACRPTTSTTA